MRDCCCVPFCRRSTRPIEKSAKLHCFPRSIVLLEKWIKAVNISDPAIEEDIRAKAYQYRVCDLHFATNQFQTPQRLRLNRGAIPILFLNQSDEIPLDWPSSECHNETAVRNQDSPRDGGENISENNKPSNANSETKKSDSPERTRSPLHNNVKKSGASVHQQREEKTVVLPEQQRNSSINKKLSIPIACSKDDSDMRKDSSIQVLLCTIEESNFEIPDYPDRNDQISEHSDDDGIVEHVEEEEEEEEEMKEDNWQLLPLEFCRLCASKNDHPKQALSNWISVLDEIIPHKLRLDDGLPQYICKSCITKLYTCQKIKEEFSAAQEKLQKNWRAMQHLGCVFEEIPFSVFSEEVCEIVPNESLTLESCSDNLTETGIFVSDIYDREMLGCKDSPSTKIYTPNEARMKQKTFSYVCEECETVFSSKWELHYHKSKHGKCLFLCAYCGKKFSSKEKLEAHEQTHIVFDETTGDEQKTSVDNSEDSLVEYYQADCDNETYAEDSDAEENIVTCEDSSDHHKVKLNIGESSCDAFSQAESQDNSNAQEMSKNFHSKQKGKSYRLKYVCDECEEVFVYREELLVHKITHDAIIFKCKYCKKKYTDEHLFNIHENGHDENTSCMCDECGEVFPNTKRLMSHKELHAPPQFVCSVCNLKFHKRESFKCHGKIHLNANFKCDHCGKMFYTEKKLMIHQRLHTGEKPFQCSACGLCFISEVALLRHEFLHKNTTFKCRICEKTFATRKLLKSHQVCHTELTPFNCSICLKLFDTLGYKCAHMEKWCNKCFCIVCNRKFSSVDILIEHRSEEHTQEELRKAVKEYRKQKFKQCPVCSEAIRGTSIMVKHISENHNDYKFKIFTCGKCPKTFFKKEYLERHVRRHNKNSLICCTLCDEKFQAKIDLKAHDLLVHKNEYGFLCSICHCSVMDYSRFFEHKKKHTKDKPFVCLVCKKTFIEKRSLLKHLKRCHNLEDLPWQVMNLGTVNHYLASCFPQLT